MSTTHKGLAASALLNVVSAASFQKKLIFTFFVFAFITGKVIAQVAPITPPNYKFYINGKLKADSADVGDWVDGAGTGGFVLTNAGVPINPTTTGLRKEPYNSNSDSSFSQGSKFQDYISSLHWGTGAPDKCDINNGMYHVSTDPGNSHQWVIIGGDRLSTSGTSYIDFEFLQNTVTANANGTFTGGGPNGGRTVNDRLISMEYTNGGSVAKVYIYRWKLNGSTYEWDSTGSAAIVNGGINAFARTNAVAADVPFGAFGSASYQPYAFVEAAIDISALLSLSGENCGGLTIKTLWIKTKASASSTAALKDFINPITVSFTFGSVKIDSKGPFCVDASPITLTASPAGGTFSGTGVSGTTFSPSVAGPGTHKITYTASAGPNCIKKDSTYITVNPLPVVTPSNKEVCTGSSVSLTANVTGGTWSGNHVSGSTFNASGVAAGDYTVTYTYTDGNGCTNSGNATVTVKPNPTVSKPDNQTLCNNENTTAVSFSGTVTGTTFNWTNDNTSIGLAASGSGDIASFKATNSGSSAVVATITVTPTANGCTGTSQTFTITVNPTPTVTKPGNQTLCNNENTTSINFSGAVSGTTFNWTNDNTSIGLAASGSGNIASFKATNSGSSAVVATITVTPTANGCTGTSQTFTITVNPTPTVTKPGNQTLCNNENTTAINFSGAVSGTTFNWTNDNTSIGLAASGSGDIGSFKATNSGSVAITATITVTPTASGCTGTSQSFTITVNPTPPTPSISADNHCDGTTTLTVTGLVAGATLYWTDDLTNHDNPRLVNSAGTYYAYQVASGCQSGNGSAIASPNITPSICSITVVQPTLCTKGSITIVATGGTGISYSIDGINFNTTGIFTDLVTGDVKGLWIQNTAGCAPAVPLDCDQIVDMNNCPAENAIGDKSNNSNSPSLSESTLKTPNNETAVIKQDEINVKAYPNPFQKSINFWFVSPVSGRAIMEVYTITGQRIGIAFDGNVKAGIANTIRYNAVTSNPGLLVYRLKIGDKVVRGKIQQME